ncbi:MAG: hypothetical protein HY744_28030 [Deltaproteobacteria bacterium]|nr:hypothetical protein [Deltaproteobacteria bacterium]
MGAAWARLARCVGAGVLGACLAGACAVEPGGDEQPKDPCDGVAWCQLQNEYDASGTKTATKELGCRPASCGCGAVKGMTLTGAGAPLAWQECRCKLCKGDAGGGTGAGLSCSSGVGKLDLLLVVDNSRGMADKQQVLKEALPDLVAAFVNPRCVDENGKPAKSQPQDPAAECPANTKREIEPIEDIHIGVVTSSIGGHGADACDAEKDPTQNFSINDKAHLISRKSTQSQEGIPTFNNLGFLAWDPAGKYGGEKDAQKLADDLSQIVMGAGEVGCGYEAPLEAWYRFLVQPDPYERITLNDKAEAVLEGTDQVPLAQRKSFLRPDSLLVIVMLTDENDCSFRDGGKYYFGAQVYAPGSQSAPYHLPKPRAACAEDPLDPCCRSCGEPPGEGCDTSKDDCSGSLPPEDDQICCRCFDQKRRFGIDFLYPIDRYVAGLTLPLVPTRTGQLFPNPLFLDLDLTDDGTEVRGPDLVLFAGIVGVPWQDIARRNAKGKPDLLAGLDKEGRPVGGFQSAEELLESGTWDIIVGDPASYEPPEDPFMVESMEPRTGKNPITGDAIAPPGAEKNANAINGHERSIPDRAALQHACVFDLRESRDCKEPSQTSCDCADPSNDSALCQADDNSFGQIQYRAAALPGIRHLWLLELLGGRGIAASACPAQVDAPGAPDFGYLPAVAAVRERVAGCL